jgi:hypothetical protein
LDFSASLRQAVQRLMEVTRIAAYPDGHVVNCFCGRINQIRTFANREG